MRKSYQETEERDAAPSDMQKVLELNPVTTVIALTCFSTPNLSLWLAANYMTGRLFLLFLAVWILVPMFAIGILLTKGSKIEYRVASAYALIGSLIPILILGVGMFVYKLPLCC